MRINVTNWERFWLASIVGSGTAPTIGQLRLDNKALDILELSEEEKALVGWRTLGPGQATWSPKHIGHEWELEFPEDVWPVVVAYVGGFQQWPQDRRAEVLYDKVMDGMVDG